MAVYLDHAATTPMVPEARAAYVEALDVVGNPSSIHSQGQNARRMLEEARERVAVSLGCDPIEVVFTSGGTESVNLAIKGLYWARALELGEDPVGLRRDTSAEAAMPTRLHRRSLAQWPTRFSLCAAKRQ